MLHTSASVVGRICAILLLCIAGLLPLGASAQNASLPGITAMRITPSVIDVSSANQVVQVTLSVSAPNGFQSGEFSLLPPTGYGKQAFFDAANRIQGDAINGTYQFSLTIYQFSTPGIWNPHIDLTDALGQGQTLLEPQLLSVSPTPYLTVTGGPDTTPPAVTAFSFSPASVNTLPGPQTVTVTVRIADTQTGFRRGNFLFVAPPCSREPNGEAKGASIDSSNLIQGNANDGVYQFQVTLPQNEVDGPGPFRLYVEDYAGRNQTYTSAILAGMGFPALQVIGFDCCPQTGSLKIVTLCAGHNTPHPLSGVNVVVKDSTGTVVPTPVTAADGTVTLSNLPVGTYTISAPNTADGEVLQGNAVGNHDFGRKHNDGNLQLCWRDYLRNRVLG